MCKRTQERARDRVRSDQAFARACAARNISAKNLVLEAMRGDITPSDALNQVIAHRRAHGGQTPAFAYARR